MKPEASHEAAASHHQKGLINPTERERSGGEGWSGALAGGAVGLARWAGARGGGAVGDAGMGRVVARLLVALGLVARGGWLAGVKVTEREGDNVRGGGGAVGDARMGRVVALGLVARGRWLAGVKVTQRERT
uniref:Uncharacterized protein n=1 Tax=Fagus sylvatica TaxID=28930 RepID=A0A2N9I0T2_FAGSY